MVGTHHIYLCRFWWRLVKGVG